MTGEMERRRVWRFEHLCGEGDAVFFLHSDVSYDILLFRGATISMIVSGDYTTTDTIMTET